MRRAFTTRSIRCLTMLLATWMASPGVAAADSGASESANPKPRPFSVYTGVEPTRVRSTSRVEGATGRVEIEPVLQGDFVHHEFTIANPTNETLELALPRVCSGCMLDSYSRQIRAGGEGQIGIVIPTDALGGQTLDGRITVETSSATLPRIEIDVLLTVNEFASLSRYRVWLEGAADDPIVESVVVVPNAAYPFEITEVRARKGIWFEHHVEETQRDGRAAYEIRLRNTRRKPGPYQDVLFVRTNHPERSEFKIRVEGRIDP